MLPGNRYGRRTQSVAWEGHSGGHHPNVEMHVQGYPSHFANPVLVFLRAAFSGLWEDRIYCPMTDTMCTVQLYKLPQSWIHLLLVSAICLKFVYQHALRIVSVR